MRGRLGYVWDLILVLVQKELKLRYRGTSLGVIWSLANPLAFAFVLHVAFRRVLRIDIENYPVFILSTLFPWQWFLNSIGEGSYAFIANGQLIKKLPFPRLAIPTAVVLGDLTHFLVTVPVLAGLVYWSTGGPPPPIWLVGFPVLIVIQAVQTIALVTLLGSVTAVLRDVGQLVRVGLLLLFYLTPILFPHDMYPPDLQWLLLANPVAPLMICWRELAMEGVTSSFLLPAAAWAVGTAIVALPVHRKVGWRIAEVV
ncbi:MAG: ABC transporter permease [Proteobacteria bacterium]|nr:ABC transporter permease [Pseudomonadota bacterium]